MGARSFGLEQLHHLLERQVLMGLRRQRLLTHLMQQLRDRRGCRQIHPDRQRVDEEPDQPFDLCSMAVGHRSADDHLLLTGQPASSAPQAAINVMNSVVPCA